MSKTKTTEVRVGRLGALLKGLHGIDTLGVSDNAVILNCAENILKVQDQIDVFVAREEKIKRDVIESAQVNLATPTQQAKLSPDAQIRQQIVEMTNERVSLELRPISAPALFKGENKPQPGMIAALMPVLSDLDEVPLTESLQ